MSDTALSMKPPQVTDELYARIPALLKQGTTKAEIAAMYGVTLGTLVDSPTIRPSAHIYVRSKADWDEITDNLPQYAELPP